MGKSNTETLKIAQKYLGQGGSRFRKFCGLPAGAAWCNAFVDYIAHESGNSPLYFNGAKYTYCPTSMSWCRKNLAQIPIYIALPMDIIYFDWEPNNVPNHIGFVRERKTDQEVYTIEGNTSGGIVAQKTRTVKYVCGCYRPHYKGSFDVKKKLTVDGYFGYNSIAVMQKWLGIKVDGILGLGTVKALQKKLGVSQDGSWGKGTSKALQKLIGTSADGDFGPKSVKAFQTYLNKVVFKGAPKPAPKPAVKPAPNPAAKKTNAQKIVETAASLCWPCGTDQKKWKYSTGAPTDAYKKATPNVKKITRSDCGYFVKVVTKKLGFAFNPLNDKKVPSELKLVHKGAITSGTLKAGDIIAYKKTTGQHTLIYLGDGKIAEAGREVRFPVVRKSTKYNSSTVRKSTIRVYRAR